MTGKEKPKNFEGHGNNWAAFGDFGESEFVDTVKRVVEQGDEQTIFKKHGDFAGIIGLEPPARVLVLMREIEDEGDRKNLLESMYPFFQVSNPVEVEISSIQEWSTKSEAIIEGSVGGAAVRFFDTLYFLNRDKYEVGNSYIFNLSALAHSFKQRTQNLEITPDQEPLKGEKIDTSRMTGLMDSKYGGEFEFYHPFTSFEGKVEVLSTILYRYQFYLNEPSLLRFPLFVSEKVLGGYQPKLNDSIEGIGWLQGYLADSLQS